MKKNRALIRHIATNLALVFLVFSITVVCFMPTRDEKLTAGQESAIVYRNAGEKSDGISLMFNVYSGTTEVQKILEVLDKYSAESTFFIGGCWADDNVDCLKTIVERGHELGNHGYFHKDQDKLDFTQNTLEISRCNEFIYLATGVNPILFAPPSGAYNDVVVKAAHELKMKTILWSKDTIDWRDQNKDVIADRATKNVCGGDFVLMHPTPATVEALDTILNYYKENHLRVITVSENLQIGG